MKHYFRTALLAIGILIASASTKTHAIIGETPGQCEARYGKSIGKDAKGDTVYQQFLKKRGVTLKVWIRFLDGKAAWVMYQMSRKEAGREVDVRLEMNVVNALLLMNDPDDNWTYTGDEGDPGQVEFLSWRNERLKVTVDLLSVSLLFYTDKYAETE